MFLSLQKAFKLYQEAVANPDGYELFGDMAARSQFNLLSVIQLVKILQSSNRKMIPQTKEFLRNKPPQDHQHPYCRRCIAAPEAAQLSSKKNITKYHVNYQPSLKLKHKLKSGIATYKEGSRGMG